MSDSAGAEKAQAFDERDKAVRYYEDSGTRSNIQHLLNIMYFKVMSFDKIRLIFLVVFS